MEKLSFKVEWHANQCYQCVCIRVLLLLEVVDDPPVANEMLIRFRRTNNFLLSKYVWFIRHVQGKFERTVQSGCWFISSYIYIYILRQYLSSGARVTIAASAAEFHYGKVMIYWTVFGMSINFLFFWWLELRWGRE
jgi:hypothetical protein